MRATCLALGLLIGCGSDPQAGSGGAGQGGGPGATSANSSGPGSGGGQTSSTGSGGAPSFVGQSRVDTQGGAAKGSAHLAIAPDGTIYVSWIANDDVWVAASSDGGESFAAPVQVDGPGIAPLTSMARLPYVVADDARVAVAFNDQAGVVYLFVSPRGGADFGQGIIIGTDVPTMFRDFPKPVFLPDGSLAVAFHGYPTSGARIFVSLEENGYASTAASSGAPGVPCECCPIDIMTTSQGDLVAAFRNNVADVREMWSAGAPGAGMFASWTAASATEGNVFQCPMEGPKLAEVAGDLWMVWSARGGPNVGAVHAAISSNGAASWSGGSPIPSFSGDQPTVAIGASGTLYVTASTGSDASAVAWSEDGGSTWAGPSALEVPDGALGYQPQAESGAGAIAIAGVSTAGTVWLLRLE